MLSAGRSKAIAYVASAALLWFVVDFGTAGGFRLAYLARYGLALALFYVGHPLAFGYLIFRRGWRGQRLFWATIAALLFIEGLVIQNRFVLSFPLLLAGIPLAICVYLPLTYFPLWLVNGELGQHRRAVFLLSSVIAGISLLTALTPG